MWGERGWCKKLESEGRKREQRQGERRPKLLFCLRGELLFVAHFSPPWKVSLPVAHSKYIHFFFLFYLNCFDTKRKKNLKISCSHKVTHLIVLFFFFNCLIWTKKKSVWWCMDFWTNHVKNVFPAIIFMYPSGACLFFLLTSWEKYVPEL